MMPVSIGSGSNKFINVHDSHQPLFLYPTGRPKNLYGVHAKLQRKGIADADVSQASSFPAVTATSMTADQGNAGCARQALWVQVTFPCHHVSWACQRRPLQNLTRKPCNWLQVHDVRALRLIVSSKHDCYGALREVERLWPCVPGRFKVNQVATFSAETH
jgi:Region found in RelA / SpoT proteins